jgi:hypothetical protein
MSGYPRVRVRFVTLLVAMFVVGVLLLAGSFQAMVPGGGDTRRILRTAGVELMLLSSSAGLEGVRLVVEK